MSNFTFDIMDSAGYGYYRVWKERAYLLKLVTIPFLIKLACTTAILVLGLQDNTLRQGLVLLPATLAEGWVLAQFLRTLLVGERWPTVLPENVDEKLLDRLLLRARGIVAATLAYTLLSLGAYLLRFAIEMVFTSLGINEEAVKAGTQPEVEVNALYFIPFAGVMIALIWAVRLMYIHIPFSVLMPLENYLKAVKGMATSIRMMALFFCSMAPVMFLMVMLSRVFYHIFNQLGNPEGSFAQFVMIFVAVAADTVTGLVTTASFVWALRSILPKDPSLLKEMPKLGSNEK